MNEGDEIVGEGSNLTILGVKSGVGDGTNGGQTELVENNF